MIELTQARVRELLRYDRKTGLFFWRKAARCIKAGGHAAAASAVLALLRHSPDRSDAILRYLELTLAQPNDIGGREGALALLSADAVSAALRGEALESGRPGAAIARKRLSHALALLWNAASSTFEAKDYKAARELFSVVLSLPLPDDAVSRVRAARAACLCHLALREPQQASQYIALADKLERGEGDDSSSPCSVQTQFLRLKVALELSGDDDAALEALDSFSRCNDMLPEYWLLAALESQSKHALRGA